VFDRLKEIWKNKYINLNIKVIQGLLEFLGADYLQAGCPSCHPTNSIKALKDESVPDWGQHAATMLPRFIRNTATVVWAALPSGFKAASLL